LDLTRQLSAEAFLLAFRRFTGRRGLPATLLSDNAKTFKSASKEVVKIARAQEVLQYLANNGVTWKFIADKAPWWGGFWERLVQTVKKTAQESDWTEFSEFRRAQYPTDRSGMCHQR